ncbi:MAG: hypothetical protein HKO57_04880 [Akkermansiaceae bacterium]|nr:hypothetical protein [Akkermansiaceae bacterium]
MPIRIGKRFPAAALWSVPVLATLSHCGTMKPPGGTIETVGSGPEDLVVVEVGGQPALLTGTATRRNRKRNEFDGRLELWRPGQAKFEEQFPAGKDVPPFHPLGIYVVPSYAGPEARFRGRQLVYVINSAGKDAETIEVFSLEGATLAHRATIRTSPDRNRRSVLRGANSIAVTAEGRIFVSTFGPLNPFRRDAPQLVPPGERDPAQRKVGLNTVMMFEPGETLATGAWQPHVTGMKGPNGLSLTRDDAVLLASSYLGRAVWALPWTGPPAAVPPPAARIARLPFFADNIHRSGPGAWTVTGQRNFLSVFLHLAVGHPSPRGGYVRISSHPGQEPEMTALPGVPAPATTVPLGGRVYSGGIVAKDVFWFDD